METNKGLTDKDMMYDILNNQKYCLGIYNTMLLETSSQEIRKVVQKHLTDLHSDQNSTFQAMSALGFYKTKPAAAADITEGINMAKTMKNELK